MTDRYEETKWFEKYPGYKLGYKLIGHDKSRPVIVFVHGLGSNHTRWSEFMANTLLVHHFNLLRVDLMGHGLSLQRRRVTRQDWSADIAAILKHEGFSDAFIIGHSLGAQVAIEFAHHYPEHCSGVVMIDPTFPQLLRGVLGWARRLKWLIWCLMWVAFGLNKMGLRRRHFGLLDLWQLDKHTRIKMADQQSITKLYMNPLADLHYIPVANYLQDIFELLRPVSHLEEVHTKVMAIVSTGAQISDRKGTIQQMQRFPQTEIQSIEADHWPLTENPEQTRAIIEQWCMQTAMVLEKPGPGGLGE
ncbi:MAG: alpha/beta hydrolase [Gammaproteobacteria bacterium]|jgi:pimeloyl-ACP methyl ester carboxylesterase|nr:alpha/beta hydrolase [Gammaproteobacteria bacterium]